MATKTRQGLSRSYNDLLAGSLVLIVIAPIAGSLTLAWFPWGGSDLAGDKARIAGIRAHIVRSVGDRLDAAAIDHQALPDRGLIRMTADVLAFPSGRYTLTATQKQRMQRMAAALGRILPCFAAASAGDRRPQLDCPDGARGVLRRVVVAGHTDSVALEADAPMRTNMDLAALRASSVFQQLSDHPALASLRNRSGYPLFTVAAFGADRSLVAHDQPTSDARNRRIELQFVVGPAQDRAGGGSR